LLVIDSQSDLTTQEAREGSLESYDVVAWLDGGDTLADGLDDAGALMAEDDWERTLRILSRQGVRIYSYQLHPIPSYWCIEPIPV